MERPEPAGKIWVEGCLDTPAPVTRSKFPLSEHAEEWHYFNHGALFQYAGMRLSKQDPVADWHAQIGGEILLQPFQRTLIEGLDAPVEGLPVSWGNVVCGVRHEFWDSFLEFMGGVATVDHKKKTFAQAFYGDVDMLDPVLAERRSVLDPSVPDIKVTVFCVDTMTARYEIAPRINKATCPRFIKLPPRPEIEAMGQAVLSGDLEHLKYTHHPVIQNELDKLKKRDDSGRSTGIANGN